MISVLHSNANPAIAPNAAIKTSFPALEPSVAAFVVACEAGGSVAVIPFVTGSVAAPVSKISAVVTSVGAAVVPLPASPRVVVSVPTAAVVVEAAVRKVDVGDNEPESVNIPFVGAGLV